MDHLLWEIGFQKVDAILLFQHILNVLPFVFTSKYIKMK